VITGSRKVLIDWLRRAAATRHMRRLKKRPREKQEEKEKEKEKEKKPQPHYCM
jgi:uncharacterized membrane protein (DUF106 family)